MAPCALPDRASWGEPADRPEAIRVLRRAVELGVNFIDTADSYGPNVSEEIIAEALHPYPAGLVIATKGGFERQGPNLWTENGRPDHLRRALEGSLRRLKLDRIDLWQLHRIDAKVPEADQLGVLAEFVREGKVRHVGLSEVGVDQIERARKVVPIVSVQNKYNASDREWEDVVDYCESRAHRVHSVVAAACRHARQFPAAAIEGRRQTRHGERRSIARASERRDPHCRRASRRNADAGGVGVAARAFAR